MSTSALVGAVEPSTGYIYAINVQNNGRPTGLGKVLFNHYSSKKKLADLIAQGDASVVRDTVEASVFYHRDRKEPLVRSSFASKSAMLASPSEDYTYVFEKGRWLWAPYRGKKFRALTPAHIAAPDYE